MNKLKVGLCLTFRGTNYGMLLQAYSTQQIIEKLGYETEIIDYRSKGLNRGVKLSFGAIKVAINNQFQRYMKKKEKNEYDQIHTQNFILRVNVADQFRQNRLKNFIRCEGYNELRKKSRDYAAVLVGSDQLWLPESAFGVLYTLRFVADGVTRISYATSLGVSEYPNYAKKSAKEFWEKIDYLSVREEQGKRIINSISENEVRVVADPTYLLTNEEWEERIPTRKVIEPGYVLCYFLGDSEDIKKFARKYADRKGLRLVSILSNECCSDDSNFVDEVLIGKTPEEFINLVRNSEYVLTDSFHGLAFSVINEKQFYVFYRNRKDVKQSRNSRIDNIVKIWGLESRLIKNPEEDWIDESMIDYQRVSKLRNKFKDKSIEFLRDALEKK